MTRKLLILDLNGTLLHRAKGKKHNVSHRPFLATFTSYIFHPSSKTWLDVMVWSSVQPQNAEWMTTSTFGKHGSLFTAVWTRANMDLSAADYSRKVQTTKNLSKVWKAFPPHDSATTLLLDDSPAKAKLQPNNHVCLSEYIRSPNQPSQLQTAEGAKKPFLRPPTFTLKKSPPPPADELASLMDTLTLDAQTPPKHDQTLLAIIAILHELKDVDNVEKWIKDGGLFLNKPISPAVNEAAHKAGPEFPPSAMWFTDENLMAHFVAQGKKICLDLNISLE